MDSRELASHIMGEFRKHEVSVDDAVSAVAILMASYSAEAIDQGGRTSVEFTLGDYKSDIHIKVSRVNKSHSGIIVEH